MSAPEPDWTKLKAIGAEIETPQKQGNWDRAAFERVYAQAREAAKGHEEFTEFVVNEAEQAWL
jgi:hypothetical protein